MLQVCRHLQQYRSKARQLSPLALTCCQRFTTQATHSSHEVQIPPPPPPPPGHIDGGRTLARLARMAHVLKDALESHEVREEQMPELIADLGRDVDQAYDLIRNALNKAGRPCTVEELGDRIETNIVPISPEALNYKDYLRAANYRDNLEYQLVSLRIFPPEEAFLENEGKNLCRLERKQERRQKERELAGRLQEEVTTTNEIPQADQELTELRPVSKEQLQLRKEHLEKSTTMEHVLNGFDTALLEVGRVHKVVSSGTTSSMRALVAIGDRNGTAGYGEGKSETAQHAIERACRDAKRNLLHVDLHDERTIFHRVRGKFVCTRVTLWPKPKGSGITGNNNFSAVFQLFGIRDVGAKQHGPRSLLNAVKALFNTLSKLETPESIARSRGLDNFVLNRPVGRPGYKRRQRFKNL